MSNAVALSQLVPTTGYLLNQTYSVVFLFNSVVQIPPLSAWRSMSVTSEKKSFIKDIIVWLITSEKCELMQVYMGSQLLSAANMMNYLKQ